MGSVEVAQVRLGPVAEEVLAAWAREAPAVLEGVDWSVGGGSLLAARWGHRESRGATVCLGEQIYAVLAMSTGWYGRLRAAARAMGGQPPRAMGRACKIAGIRTSDGGAGSLVVAALPNEAAVWRTREEVDAGGRPTPAVRSAAILAAKLARVRLDVRAVYDLAAGLEGPEAGEAREAVASIGRGAAKARLEELARLEWPPDDVDDALRAPRWPQVARTAKVRLMAELHEVAAGRSTGG